MKKKIFFAAMAIALASCTSDDFIGENNNSPNPVNGPEKAIMFNTGTKATTRATKTGSDAATLLNEKFVFAGTKLGKETTPVTHLVFDQYYANWEDNTANTTESNSSNWEYVGYTPYGAGNTAISTLPSGAVQTIKYWDYNTTKYDFAAYSLGEGADLDGDASTAKTFATASKIDPTTMSFTLTGKAEELKACYVSDLVTAYNQSGVSDYGKIVQFSFRSMAAKIRLAFYETIPGYSVRDIKFYTSDAAALATDGTESDPTLYVNTSASFSGIPSGEGVMTITYPTKGYDNRSNTDYNKAHVSFASKTASDVSTTLVLEDLANLAAAEAKEAAGNYYIGRASNAATYAGGISGTPAVGKYHTVLPYEDGANLLLRIKYTLVSTDGSGESITVDNAKAVIPKELAQWNPNFAYTYIFKISDMTNGTTGVDGSGTPVYGLTPITLNAVVVDSEDGVQETITTVNTPSITTYTKGKVVTANDEYKTGAPIYVIVNNGTSNVTLTTTGTVNANLYTAVLTDGATSGTSAQEITEESIANALAHGTYNETAGTYTVTDAQGATLVLTKSNLLAASEEIAATDSPTGNKITVTGAKFTPAATGTYVFEYVKTARTAGTYTAVDDGTILTKGVTYYTSSDGKGGFVSDGTQVANGTNYYSEATTPSKGEYFYKIIKVQ